MAEEKKFEVGDVVQLKSGSPAMTIQYTKNAFGSRSITCIYFDEDKKPVTVGDLDDVMLEYSTNNENKALPIFGGK